MNIFSLFDAIYKVITKQATNEYKIDVYDLCLVRVALGILIPSIPVLKMFGKKPFDDFLKEF